jgi:hypothetical protein
VAEIFTPQPSVMFLDATSGREMLYVYPTSTHYSAGWLHFKGPSGWVSLRKATWDDIERINKAVVEGHHCD